MKKLFVLCVLSFVFVISAQAQRRVDDFDNSPNGSSAYNDAPVVTLVGDSIRVDFQIYYPSSSERLMFVSNPDGNGNYIEMDAHVFDPGGTTIVPFFHDFGMDPNNIPYGSETYTMYIDVTGKTSVTNIDLLYYAIFDDAGLNLGATGILNFNYYPH
jgi:hypothetical protein